MTNPEDQALNTRSQCADKTWICFKQPLYCQRKPLHVFHSSILINGAAVRCYPNCGGVFSLMFRGAGDPHNRAAQRNFLWFSSHNFSKVKCITGRSFLLPGGRRIGCPDRAPLLDSMTFGTVTYNPKYGSDVKMCFMLNKII